MSCVNEDVIFQDIQNKAKERGFYGTVEEKPQTEQDLFALQAKFLAKKEEYRLACNKYLEDVKVNKNIKKPVDESRQVWSEMLDIVFSYTKSCVLKRNKNKCFMQPEEVIEKSLSAALSFMNQYLKNDDFYVGASFCGMIRLKIVEALYKNLRKPDEEKHQISLSSTIANDSYNELVDTVTYDNDLLHSTQEVLIEDKFCKRSLQEITDELLLEIDEVVGKESKRALLARLYILMSIRGPKVRHTKRLFKQKWAPSFKMEQFLDLSALELRDRIAENI